MKVYIKKIQDFNTLYDAWNELNEQSINQVIMSAEFIQHCINSFAKGDEILVHVEDDDGTVSIAVLSKAGMGRWQTFQPSQAPLGLWITRNNAPSQALLKAIAKALPGYVFMIDFLQQDTTSLSLKDLQNVILTPYIETGKLSIPEDFEAYFSQLSKNTRQNYNKVYNRAKKAGQTLSSKKLVSKEEVHGGLSYYSDFETSGWKGKTGTAVNFDNPQGKFYLNLLSAFAQRGNAEIWQFTVNNEVVATDLCISSMDTLIILKTAYNENFKHLSPALCLKYDIIKHHSSANSVNNIEFFGKAMDWHKKLKSEIRPIQHVTWFASSVVKRVYLTLKSDT